MGRLIHKKKAVLENMQIMSSTFRISVGLMFSSRKSIERGACLIMPGDKDLRFGSSVTMFMVFYPMDILFVNLDMKVVDKVCLKPFKFSYTPKEAAKYIIESSKGSFDKISIGDRVTIEL